MFNECQEFSDGSHVKVILLLLLLCSPSSYTYHFFNTKIVISYNLSTLAIRINRVSGGLFSGQLLQNASEMKMVI